MLNTANVEYENADQLEAEAAALEMQLARKKEAAARRRANGDALVEEAAALYTRQLKRKKVEDALRRQAEWAEFVRKFPLPDPAVAA